MYLSLSGFLIAMPALAEPPLGFQPLRGTVKKRGCSGKAPGSETRGPGSNPRSPSYCVTWVSHLASLCLSLLICKTGTMTLPTSKASVII